MDKRAALDELKAACDVCENCGLAAGRAHVVFGEGDPAAAVMFVGEGPGEQEDLQGRPFVGNAGRLLDSMLEKIGLTRGRVYIGNIIKCRPPGNRDPKPEEVDACRDYINAQIAIIQPRILCTLGRHAANNLLGLENFKISRDHGRTVRWKGLTALPMFHPAAALHQSHFMSNLQYDFQQLEQLLIRERIL